MNNNTLNSFLNFKYEEADDSEEEETNYYKDDLQVELIKTNCYGSVTCQYSVDLKNVSKEHSIKDWKVKLPLSMASSCSVSGWNGNYTLDAESFTITAKDSNGNVIEKESSYTNVGFQITCPSETMFNKAELTYTVVTSGEIGGGTGEGGESGGTSEDTTTITKENLTVNFTRTNYWPSGTGYNA